MADPKPSHVPVYTCGGCGKRWADDRKCCGDLPTVPQMVPTSATHANTLPAGTPVEMLIVRDDGSVVGIMGEVKEVREFKPVEMSFSPPVPSRDHPGEMKFKTHQLPPADPCQ